MAVAGDVVIKLAADFAEFKKGMDDANKKLDEFGASANKASALADGFFGAIKVGAIATAVVEGIKQLIAYGEQIQKSATDVANLAEHYKLTTDQVQALQAVSKTTGQSLDELAKIGKQNVDWLAQLTENAKAAGQVIDGEVVQKFKDMTDESERASHAMDVVFAPLFLLAKSTVVSTMNSVVQYFVQLSRLVNEWNMPNWEKIVAFLVNPVQTIGVAIAQNAMGVTPLTQRLDELKSLNAEIDKSIALQQQYAASNSQAAASDASVEAQRQKRLEAQRAEVQERIKQLTVTPPNTPLEVPALREPAKAGGGGGKTDEDYIQAQIDRYTALGKTAAAAYDTISKGQGQNIEDLKRSVTVQQQVDEIVAKQIARHQQVTDAQKKQLYAAVEGYEQQKAAAQKLLEVNIAAVETDKKYGDGTVARAKLQKDLNDQLKTGRITTDDYNRSLKENSEAIEQSSLAAKRYDDDLGSLGAGFEHAANAYARANDMYSLGEQAFSGLTDAMTEGLKVLEGQSNKTFGQIAANFANMLADMALRAAVSQAFKLLVSAASSYFGGGAAGGADAIMGLIPARAAGGPVNQGQPYLVGEQGAELFVPDAAGRIVSNGQSGGSVGDVTINVAMSGQQSTMGAGEAAEFGRRLKQTVVATIQNEQRPGGTLYQRKSA